MRSHALTGNGLRARARRRGEEEVNREEREKLKRGPSSPNNRVLILAARTLNAVGEPRVTLPLR